MRPRRKKHHSKPTNPQHRHLQKPHRSSRSQPLLQLPMLQWQKFLLLRPNRLQSLPVKRRPNQRWQQNQRLLQLPKFQLQKLRLLKNQFLLQHQK